MPQVLQSIDDCVQLHDNGTVTLRAVRNHGQRHIVEETRLSIEPHRVADEVNDRLYPFDSSYSSLVERGYDRSLRAHEMNLLLMYSLSHPEVSISAVADMISPPHFMTDGEREAFENGVRGSELFASAGKKDRRAYLRRAAEFLDTAVRVDERSVRIYCGPRLVFCPAKSDSKPFTARYTFSEETFHYSSVQEFPVDLTSPLRVDGLLQGFLKNMGASRNVLGGGVDFPYFHWNATPEGLWKLNPDLVVELYGLPFDLLPEFMRKNEEVHGFGTVLHPPQLVLTFHHDGEIHPLVAGHAGDALLQAGTHHHYGTSRGVLVLERKRDL